MTNEVVIAAAGSGKTRRLVDEALANRNSRVLITTYTRENCREIEARLWEASGRKPHSVTVMSWYEFLLRECIKPYQSYKTDILSIRSIDFLSKKDRYAPKKNFARYFLDSAKNLYSETVSDLACELDIVSNGKVVARLEECFDAIFVDELQDLAGHDLDLLDRLFKSGIRILGVADPRQVVYVTNHSARFKQYRYADITKWIELQEKAGLLSITRLTESYRCNQLICDFGDSLYPDLQATTSRSSDVVADMGVHLVHGADLEAYRELYLPRELRWGRGKSDKLAIDPSNFGEVKGRSFDRVLIHPTGKMTAFVESGDDLKPETRAKFYVGATRARHSIGIVTDSKSTASAFSYWSPVSR